MEPVLTNICEYDENHLTQAMKIQLRVHQKNKNLFLMILIAALLCFSLFKWLTGGDSQFLVFAILSVVMAGLLAYTNYGLPRLTARRQIPLLREKNGGLRFQFQFREEGVAVLGPTGEETALRPYGDFIKLVETPDLFLLLTESKQMILLDRQGFRNGTEADFRALAKERIPQFAAK